MASSRNAEKVPGAESCGTCTEVLDQVTWLGDLKRELRCGLSVVQ